MLRVSDSVVWNGHLGTIVSIEGRVAKVSFNPPADGHSLLTLSLQALTPAFTQEGTVASSSTLSTEIEVEDFETSAVNLLKLLELEYGRLRGELSEGHARLTILQQQIGAFNSVIETWRRYVQTGRLL